MHSLGILRPWLKKKKKKVGINFITAKYKISILGILFAKKELAIGSNSDIDNGHTLSHQDSCFFEIETKKKNKDVGITLKIL